MYRNKDEVLEALKSGKTSVRNCRQRSSDYRKAKRLELVIMFMSAIEEYKMFHQGEE